METNSLWRVNDAVLLSSAEDPNDYLFGPIVSLNPFTVNIVKAGGSGIHADWLMNTGLSGFQLDQEGRVFRQRVAAIFYPGGDAVVAEQAQGRNLEQG